MFMTVKEAAIKWGISERRIRTLVLKAKLMGHFMMVSFGKYLLVQRNQLMED